MGFVPNMWGNWASPSLMRIFRSPSNQPWAEKHFFFFLQPSLLIDPFRHNIITSNLSDSSRAVTLLIRHSKSPVSALRPPLDVALRCEPPPLERQLCFQLRGLFRPSQCTLTLWLAFIYWCQAVGVPVLKPDGSSQAVLTPALYQISQRDDCSTSECLHHRPPRSPQSV